MEPPSCTLLNNVMIISRAYYTPIREVLGGAGGVFTSLAPPDKCGSSSD